MENKSVVADESNEVGGWDGWLKIDDWLEVDDDCWLMLDENELGALLLVYVMMEASGIDVALAYSVLGKV